MSSILQSPTLVLNRSWVAVATTTVRTAIALVYKGGARIIEPETFQVYDFQAWTAVAVPDDGPVIRTVRLVISAPEIVLLVHHDRMPRRTVPFSRRNLYRRDAFRCQYCGRRCSTLELSIDHVFPRSRGGPTNWENCVLACIPCNVRKSDRTLAEAGMRLIAKPVRPRWSPCLNVAATLRRPSWEKFVASPESLAPVEV